jgi:hypothetical protein
VFFLIDNYLINMEVQNLAENENSLADLVAEYGIKVNNDLMYDLRFNETVRFSDGFISYFLPYPYWLKAIPLDNTNPITFKLNSILVPWGSSLTIAEQEVSAKGYTLTPLITTTPYSGVKTEAFVLDPAQQFSADNLGERTVAVSLQGENTGGIIVIGDSDFLANQTLQSNPENLVFGTNAISWLSDEESLGDIRIKAQPFGTFLFKSEDQPTQVKYVNMGLAFAVPVLVGSVRLFRRRKLSAQKYSS